MKQKKQCTDHLGNVFSSETERAKSYGLCSSTIRDRLKHNWTLEKALTTPPDHTCGAKECTDHLGNVFSSETERAKSYGLEKYEVINRLRLNWTLEKALTTPSKRHKKYTDHLGNEFDTEKEMYKHHGVNTGTYYRRKEKSGGDIRYALTGEITKNYKPAFSKIKITDPFTNNKMYITDFLNKYNSSVNHHVFYSRINRNECSIISACGISFVINRRYININQTKYDITVAKRTARGKDVFECYIDNGNGDYEFKIMSMDMIDNYCMKKFKELHPELFEE